MSDETTMDAEVIADFQKHIATSDYRTGQEEEIIMISATLSEIVGFALASHRTGRALTAERDAARAELARQREACKGVPDMLDDAAKDYSPRFRAKAADIRAALDAPEKE